MLADKDQLRRLKWPKTGVVIYFNLENAVPGMIAFDNGKLKKCIY